VILLAPVDKEVTPMAILPAPVDEELAPLVFPPAPVDEKLMVLMVNARNWQQGRPCLEAKDLAQHDCKCLKIFLMI
jgi:hypothetical protein